MACLMTHFPGADPSCIFLTENIKDLQITSPTTALTMFSSLPYLRIDIEALNSGVQKINAGDISHSGRFIFWVELDGRRCSDNVFFLTWFSSPPFTWNCTKSGIISDHYFHETYHARAYRIH